jgi:hypothetical protein
MTDTQAQSRQQENEPEAIISEWWLRFTCPVDGRTRVVGPQDFSTLVVHSSKNTAGHIHLLVRCLCGGVHNLEVE